MGDYFCSFSIWKKIEQKLIGGHTRPVTEIGGNVNGVKQELDKELSSGGESSTQVGGAINDDQKMEETLEDINSVAEMMLAEGKGGDPKEPLYIITPEVYMQHKKKLTEMVRTSSGPVDHR